MKRKFKLQIAYLISIMMLCILGGCQKKTASPEDVEFLTGSKYWYHYNEVTGENEKMHFDEDFSFYWGCECGEPIGDSDCYELYDYDKETSIIRLYNEYDDMTMELEVLDYNEDSLSLRIDGEIKDYTSVEPDEK